MTSPPVSITAYSLCNAMGMSTAEVLAGLERGVSGLRPCPPEFFRSGVAGVLPGELPALPAALRQRDARITRMMAVSLEARCLLADYDPASDLLTIHTSSQVPHMIQAVFARTLRTVKATATPITIRVSTASPLRAAPRPEPRKVRLRRSRQS